MTHQQPADAYRAIQLLTAAGARCKLIADRFGWHVSVIKKEKKG